LSEESELQELNRLALERARALERAIDLGLQVEEFLAGELGQKLLADAERDRNSLVDDYLKLNPALDSHREPMVDILFQIRVIDHWQQAFGHYKDAGLSAQAQYQEEGVVSNEPPA
jgi:dynactin complex subunit